MRHILYIFLITIVFFIVGSLLKGHWSDALPVAMIGACLGWAVSEFMRETRQQ